ncbi:MAG: hypothetical protein OXE84_03555 [Rhodobacteraceae bacterium]|nr:hypothetical protein [Paracoccaceae bacterium]MCY4195783.1 hypothetical protein [Paracoccaceae bacterium]
MEELSDCQNPIPPDKLEDAMTVVTTMFGNGSIGRNAVVQDSRQLSELATAFADPEKVKLLRSGKDLLEVLDKTQPIGRKLDNNLVQAQDLLSDLVSSVSQTPPSADLARKHLETSRKTQALAVDLAKRLKDAATDPEVDDG